MSAEISHEHDNRIDEECDLAEIDIAVIIPCYNEAAAIANVVAGFRRSLGRDIEKTDSGARIVLFEKGNCWPEW